MAPILQVEDLVVEFPGARGSFRAADRVSFAVEEGRTLGLVGESGCGKSVTALSLLRLVPEPGRIASGRILFRGSDLMALTERRMCAVRGREIGFVFQEPAAALNPVLTVGTQIAEGLVVHRLMKKKEALAEAARLLELVRIPDAARRVHEYPHQLSGGMLQRVMIACALACKPSLVIADEPTTALDVTIQAAILDLLRSLRDELGLSLLLISHNLGVIAGMADRVAVMYAGRIVEEASARRLFRDPAHPYTRGLLRSMPRPGSSAVPGPRARRLPAIEGTVPDLARLPAGCAFHPRCSDVMPECREVVPALLPLGAAAPASAGAAAPADAAPDRAHRAACFLHHDTAGRPRSRPAAEQAS